MEKIHCKHSFLLAFVLLSLVLWIPITAHASEPYGAVLKSGDCGKNGGSVTYTLYEDGTLVISGTGEMADYMERDSHNNDVALDKPWGESGVKSVVIESGVTSVGKGAFLFCETLESVELPEGLTEIGSSAFERCKALTEIELPKSVESVGWWAFQDSGLVWAHVYYTLEWDESIEHQIFPNNSCVVRRYGKTLTPEAPLIPTRTEPVASNHIHAQTYDSYYSSTVKSYLAAGENGGFYRVDHHYENGEPILVMEEYNAAGEFLRGWDIPWEHPLYLFGGFYAGSDGYYFVFGDTNGWEQDDKEVIRVVKYSKKLERLGESNLSGINVFRPFDSASLRMDEGDGILYVHTGRLMYRSSNNGQAHQANLTFSIDMSNMDVLSVNYVMSHWSDGYVSHSFNQFVKVDGDLVVRLDQGDAFPRGAYLVRTSPSLRSQFESGIVFDFDYNASSVGNINHTGVDLGGLEISNSSYLIALSSIDQEKFAIDLPRNVYLVAVDKKLDVSERREDAPDFLKNQCIQVTNYQAGDGCDASCPQLVKVSNNKFALLWEERLAVPLDPSNPSGYDGQKTTGEVCYAFFDGEGNQLSGIYRMPGALSDCQPVMVNGEILWYVTKNSQPVFYRIPTDGIRACVPSGGAKNVTLLDPTGILSGCKSVYAARYNTRGRMTGLAYGRLEGGRAVFDQTITGDWTLFFLDSQEKPVCPKLPVSEG